MLSHSRGISSAWPITPLTLLKMSSSGCEARMCGMARGNDLRGAEIGMPQPLNPTIFILEDDPDIAGLLKHHLQAAGYGISWFPMSGGFLDEMYARRPALVILDIMVPGSNGLDLAKAIRNNSALAGIPIIFVTA